MSDNIIKWESEKGRKPLLSFLLSILSPGLGQIYNGQIAKGIVFFLLLFCLILFPVIYSFIGNKNNLIVVYSVSFFSVILTCILSSLDAVLVASFSKKFKFTRANRIVYYFLYFVVINLILFVILFINSSFFSLKKMNNESMYPSISKGDLVLLYSDIDQGYSYGDVVRYKKNNIDRITRIIAGKNNDFIKIKKGEIEINGITIKRGVLTSSELEDNKYPNDEFIYQELNRSRFYIIKYSRSGHFRKVKYSYRLKKNELFILPDNRESRAHEVIIKSTIYDKVVGVIYSERNKKIIQPL